MSLPCASCVGFKILRKTPTLTLPLTLTLTICMTPQCSHLPAAPANVSMGLHCNVWGLLLVASTLLAGQPAVALSAAKCRSFISSSNSKVRAIKNQCTSLANHAVDFNSCEHFAQVATASQKVLVSIFYAGAKDYSACAKRYRASIDHTGNDIKSTISYCHGLYDKCEHLPQPVSGGGGGGVANECELCTATCQALCSSCAQVSNCGSQYVPSCIQCGQNPYCCG